MSNENYQAIFNTVDSFPPLPATVTKVLQVMDNPESSARDLMDAILPDQSMCVAILKVANSAFFGRPKQVSSLETAVMVLGFNEIQSIVLGKAVFDSFTKLSTTNGKVTQFWNHAFYCGLAAKIIAEEVSLSPGNLFVAGLIHDIGKLALLITFPNDYSPDIWLESHTIYTSLDAEKGKFTIGHDALAARLLKRWFFPEQLISAVEFHHSPQLASSHKELALIVYLGDIFSYYLENPGTPGDTALLDTVLSLFPDFIDHWQSCKLPWQDDMLERIFEKLQEEHQSGTNLMGIISA